MAEGRGTSPESGKQRKGGLLAAFSAEVYKKVPPKYQSRLKSGFLCG